ncbi:MAG TPA: hypothetical protein EYH03_06715 [Chromatiales bacterium]|nr:hypothetical protein [Chromatiales bacterium]
MRARLLLLPLLWTLLLPLRADGLDPMNEVLKVTDLHAVGRLAARQRLPLLLMVSQEHCPFCILLKREVIRPMIISGDYDDKVIIREMFMDPGVRVRDFDGTAVDATALAHRMGVSLTPTLLLIDADGTELAPRIIGVRTLDMYSYYLDTAIEEALERLRRRSPSEGHKDH